MKQNRVLILVLSSALSLSGAALARSVPPPPVKHKAPHAKPNLDATRRDLEQAYSSIGAAQLANEFDAEGHAEKAKALINQAYQELRLATQTATAEKPADADKPADAADKK